MSALAKLTATAALFATVAGCFAGKVEFKGENIRTWPLIVGTEATSPAPDGAEGGD